MIPYTPEVVALLNERFLDGEEYVESVLLASYGFKIQFATFEIQCNERVFASIDGIKYEWNDAPNSGPWGALGRQRAATASLKSPTLLNITFQSSDLIEIETVVGPYESVVFQFPPREGSIVMEVF